MGTAQANDVEIVLNGEKRQVPAHLNIEGLLAWLKMDPTRVAVEFNGVIARKPTWNTTEVAGGSQIEIVWFVGGGRI
jgi:thiamine biosynthesis protein ThiS